jgi:hypothetical protein
MRGQNHGSKFEPSGFTEQLKAKSPRRRETLADPREAASRRHPARNDLSPLLVLVELPIDALRAPSRKVRRLDEAHVQEIVRSIAALGFCAPILIGRDNLVLDGQSRLEAARRLGFARVPCIRVDHLSESEQRLLGLAVNRLGEKGGWNLDELKVEFEELILADAPIEITGFTLDEIDQIVLDDQQVAIEAGPLAPNAGATAVARPGGIFLLGPHRLACGDATDPEIWRRLMDGGGAARLLLSDEPYNVPIQGHVTGSGHREFAIASGEMSDEEFLAFNVSWIGCALPWLSEGAVFGSFIDWRGYPTVFATASKLDLNPKTDGSTAFEIANDRAVPLIALPSPIVDTHDDRGRRLRTTSPANDSQKRVVAHRQHQATGKTRRRTAAQGETEMMDEVIEPLSSARRRSQHIGAEALDENAARTAGLVTAKAPGDNDQPNGPTG